MPFTPIHARRLNLAHPLLSGVSNVWLPTPALSGASRFWDIRGAGFINTEGLLTNGPTWRNTAYGPGVETGVVARNAYIDLAGFQLSRGFSMMFAYTYRFDGTSSGSNLETGSIFSAGFNGVYLRHGYAGNMTLLKSRVAAIVDVAAAATAGDFRTAGFSIPAGGTVTMNVFSQGKLLGSASSALTFTGQAPTTLGWDNLTPATNDEYGRHTLLGAALWNGRVLTTADAQQWHEIAQQGYRPLFNRRRAFFMGSGTITASSFLPSASKPVRVPPAPEVPRPRPSPLAFLLSAGVVGGGDWMPFMARRAPGSQPSAPARPTTRSFGWLFAGGLRPPGGLTKQKAKPYLNRVPVIPGEESQVGFARLARFATVLSNQWNSLVRQGILVQTPTADSPTGADGFQIRASAHVDVRDPGAMDDSDNDFPVGCSWVNSVTKKVWFCTSNTPGAATWSGPF